MNKLPLLTVDGGPNDGNSTPIVNPTTTLGRADDGDVVVGGPGVSRKHAVILMTDTGWCLRDLGSTNGTFVNGSDIGRSQHFLLHGDEIRLGTSKVYLVFRTDATSTVEMRPAELLPEPGTTAADDPPQRALEYLRNHPDGAGFDALQSVTDTSGKNLVDLIAQLLRQNLIHQRQLLFFAGGKIEHFCQEHNQEFERYGSGGSSMYAHVAAGVWCYEP